MKKLYRKYRNKAGVALTVAGMAAIASSPASAAIDTTEALGYVADGVAAVVAVGVALFGLAAAGSAMKTAKSKT